MSVYLLEHQSACFSIRVIAVLMMLSTSVESRRRLLPLQGCRCKVAITTTTQAYAVMPYIGVLASPCNASFLFFFYAQHVSSSLAVPLAVRLSTFIGHKRSTWRLTFVSPHTRGTFEFDKFYFCIICIQMSVAFSCVCLLVCVCVCARVVLSCIINHGNLISAIISKV